MKKLQSIEMRLLAGLTAVSTMSIAQIKMESNGDVIVGEHWGSSPSLEFDVRGQMFVSHVPRNGVSGWNYVGCYFENHSYTFGGSTVYRPILKPQWGNNFWLGNASSPFWRVYANEMYATAFNITSDARLKENFVPIETSLDRILKLKPYYFDYKFKPTEQMDDAMKQEIPASYKDHAGFKAQDLLEDFPKLVKYDETEDRYSLDYIGLIPEMVTAMKEQNQTIEELKQELEMVKGNCCSNTSPNPLQNDGKSSGGASDMLDASKLEQNQPNPFHQETTIKYYLAEQTNQATMYIYDMNGKQIESFNLREKRNQSLTIQKNKLQAGMYYYSLIVDGKEIATKKMILTE